MKINLAEIKEKNEVLLSHLDLLNFHFLPPLTNSFVFKNSEKIKERAFILSIIIQVAFNKIDKKDGLIYINNNNLNQSLTKKELQFLKNPGKEDKINETWKSECLYTLLWALSIVENIEDFSSLADLNSIEIKNYPFVNLNTLPEKFMTKSDVRLRDKTEIIKMLDMFSRLDYICDWYKINNLNLFLNSALIFERRYALIWLTSNTDWDKVECNSIL